MGFSNRRAAACLRAVVLCFGTLTVALFAAPSAAAAPISTGAAISGVVDDAATGLPIPNVTVRVVSTKMVAHSDAAGSFTVPSLAKGTYRLSLSLDGYQPAISEPIVLNESPIDVTLTMHRATSDLRVIAVTTVHATESLQQSSTFTKTLNTEELTQQGVVRAADALRTLPGVNNGITGDTAALADDVQISLRGIGTLETEAAIDGHPIAYGIKGGFNYQLSPVFPYRDISVLYGSGGSDLTGVNAIGGVIDFQTLDPTPIDTVNVTQGYGTFNQLSTSLTATGTRGRLGYAAAYGVSALDGPFRNDSFYQAGAAFDQSVLSGPVHNLGMYEDDSDAVTRAGLAKLQYNFSPVSALTFTSVDENRWVDKTGNGDGDYLPYAPALAFGNLLLGEYNPANYPNLPACPKGTFVGTNANGSPNGVGPNGQPDGGVTCQTPQQYAQFNTGWDGAGPSWQSLKLLDNSLDYRVSSQHSVMRLGVYNSYYENLVDRTFMLPFFAQPGDAGSWQNFGVNETGAVASDDLVGRNNDVEFGASYMNSAYFTYVKNSLKGAPVVTERAYFIRDAFRPAESPFSAYLNIWAKHSTATNTSYVDSRLAAVYRLDSRDRVRASAGSTTTQPSQNMLGQQFIETFPGGAGGGAPIGCGNLNSIGSAPSTILKPEQGVDEDLAYVHSWQGDSQTQLTLYNTNVYNKLYSTLVPLSTTGTGFVPASYLAQVEAAVGGKCGAGAAFDLLGVTGNVNVGTLRAQGVDLSGRYRVSSPFYVDYDWALTSTSLLNANPDLLRNNLTYILGGQLPRLPLHTFSGAADYTFKNGIDARYTLYTVSSDNTKSLPAYDYSNLSVSAPVGPGTKLTATVQNLFNQWGSIAGLRYEGVPLPLNGYAPASAYAPYTGAAATEQFGLPYRTIYFSYSITR
ncbi:MAG TPA: carboxypeptidase regulatory-like domain-containing protein [Candidatus Baltobacteraceae bacterium]|nr:carboxypeptidase regulatory-like domain-containing protein [Candidatus Baltobacteraceae bacterium]